MRWLTLMFLISSPIYSVLSEEANDGQPSLRIIPKSAVITVGDKRAIYCEGNNLPNENIHWKTPSGSNLEPKSNRNTRVYLEKNILKGTKKTWMAALVIKTAVLEDSGNWTCEADDLHDTIEVFVGEKMNISDVQETPYRVEEGKNINFDCFAKGYPLPSAQWYKDGIPLHVDAKKYRITHSNNYNNKLEVRNLNHTDSGDYACKLTQKLFMVFAEKKFILYVKHKPILLDREGNEITSASVQEDYAILNEIKVLKCSSKAFPPAKYTWGKKTVNNFYEEIPEDELGKEPSTPLSVKSDPSGDYSELTIVIRDQSFLGEYRCIARNEQGTKEVIYHLNSGNKPKTPASFSLESVNDTNVVFNVTCENCTFPDEAWTKDTIYEYNFQFVEFKDGFPADWESEYVIELNAKIESSNDTLFVVGPLPNSTKLHARVRSRNQAGFSDWFENSLVFETSKAVQLTATFVIVLIAYFVLRN